MKERQLDTIASAVDKRVGDGLTELLHNDPGYKELCSKVASESQALYKVCNTPELRQKLEQYMDNYLSIKSAENHFTYMLGLSDLDWFKKAVGSKDWDSVMFNCVEWFIAGEISIPIELPLEEERHTQSSQKRHIPFKRIPILFAVLGMAICLLTGACLPALFQIITEGDTFTRIASGVTELPDTMDDNTFRSLVKATEHYGLKNVAPLWIPENYTLNSVGSNEEDGYTSIYAWYASDFDAQEGISMRIVCYQQAESMVEKYEMETEGGEEKFSNGIRYFVTQNKQNLRAVWAYGNCICSISGPVSNHDLKQMIQSTQ